MDAMSLSALSRRPAQREAKMFKVKMIMTTEVESISPEATVQQAAELLAENEVSGLPVVDCEGHLVGMITEYDLLKLVYEPHLIDDPVADHMTSEVVSVHADDALTDLADLFLSSRVRRVPVLAGDRFVGIVSRHDLIRFVRKSTRQVDAYLHR